MPSAVAKKKAEPTVFGRCLAARRIAAGLTQKQLGEAVGMKRLAIWRLETSPNANPTLSTASRLAVALGISLSELAGEEPTG